MVLRAIHNTAFQCGSSRSKPKFFEKFQIFPFRTHRRKLITAFSSEYLRFRALGRFLAAAKRKFRNLYTSTETRNTSPSIIRAFLFSFSPYFWAQNEKKITSITSFFLIWKLKMKKRTAHAQPNFFRQCRHLGNFSCRYFYRGRIR